MGSAQDDINVMELLLKISENVSAIKTDMSNFKETYKSEKDNLITNINDVRSDAKMDLAQAKSTLQMEIDAVKKVQEEHTKAIEKLQIADTEKDAKKWRVVIAFVLTAVGGFLMSYVFDFVKFVLNKLLS
jgi:hypothetical protein